MNYPAFKGGQGRSSESVIDDGRTAAFCALAAIVALGALRVFGAW